MALRVGPVPTSTAGPPGPGVGSACTDPELDGAVLGAATEETVAAGTDDKVPDDVTGGDADALPGPAEPTTDPLGDGSAAPVGCPEHPATPASSRTNPAPRSARRETSVGMIRKPYCR